ncbi:aminotransferase class III-fold pyridoxal phosphate-dependent enzyme [Rhodococcus koreensis]
MPTHHDVLDRFARIHTGPPPFDDEGAAAIVARYFGPDFSGDVGALSRVPGETDANYTFTIGATQYLLKVSHAADEERIILQQEVLRHLHTCDLPFGVPRVVDTAAGDHCLRIHVGSGDLIARVLTWLPGHPLGPIEDPADELLDDIGSAAAALAASLDEVELGARPSPTSHWDLDTGRAVIDTYRDQLPAQSALLTRVLEITDAALAAAGPLPQALIHNDLNVFNLLATTSTHRTRVSGIIDFGDMLITSRINDLAILIAAVCRGGRNFVTKAARIAAAYHRRRPLTATEIDVLFPLVLLRTATVLVTTAQLARTDPRHRRTIRPEHLEDLASKDPRVVAAAFRNACGFPRAHDIDRAARWITESTHRFVPIVDGPVRVTDHSVRSTHFDGVDPLDTTALTAADTGHAAGGSDTVATIGRYREPHFTRGGLRTHAADRDDIILALQVQAQASTEILAPIAGHARAGADGVLIIDHTPAGAPVWTRYRGLVDFPMGAVGAGTRIGRTTGPATPVLAQLLTVDPDTVDVPWFCSSTDIGVFEQFAPDASALLGADHAARPWAARLPGSLARRAAHLPRTHPTYFEQPLDMVRAHGCWFFDENGNRYLDALNNVTLLGHCHPRLTAAAARQLGRLQTNSRFVYDALTDYTDALVETLPDGLDVVYMLNSGSEANDLALRMARHVTGRDDIVVIEDAYHGYTSVVSDVSPARYKHYGKPDTTHAVPNPDRYRGAYGYDDPDAGMKYAREVIAEFDRLIAEGRPPAAFIYEALLAGGGQVVLPPNYLAPIHAAARERGILTIADEVQVGFGRLGSAFWGFQTQGPHVVPDFVTMGKSMGNGFPVAAMVTTRDHSRSFDETGRFFSTYGGNPTACVVAHEVLNVLADEGLQQNADTTGEYLRHRLRELGRRHPLIGDVRGQGFYSGVEFVLDSTTKQHASAETLIICNRMKDNGVLVYPTGPQWNILKIKPPLTFTEDHADFFVDALDGVLTRGW